MHPAVTRKRIYEAVERGDGFRILVDRLWPRGVSKAKAHVDLWLKDIAPSDALRKWFGHDPKKWGEFRKRYRQELKKHREAVAELRLHIKGKKAVTLLYAASDEEHNNAAALMGVLKL